MQTGRDAPGQPIREGGWGRSAAAAGIVLALAVLGLAVVPDRLLAWLSPRTSPLVRDLLVTAWVTAWFVLLARWFVALQRRWGG